MLANETKEITLEILDFAVRRFIWICSHIIFHFVSFTGGAAAAGEEKIIVERDNELYSRLYV